jgi:hypothetical protein
VVAQEHLRADDLALPGEHHRRYDLASRVHAGALASVRPESAGEHAVHRGDLNMVLTILEAVVTPERAGAEPSLTVYDVAATIEAPASASGEAEKGLA